MDSRVQIFSNYIEVTAPSNIAFVKYWGKKGNQLPANPSLSMTLKNSKTIMEVGIKDGKSLSSVDFEFFNEEKMKVSSEFFSEKIQKYFQQLERNYGELPYQIKIKSYNTFPHSCGIASSASSFACLAAIYFYLQKKDLQKKLNLSPEDLNLISDYARQGSGSSCRSILPGFNLWGNFEAKTKKFGFSGRDDYAVNLNHIVSSQNQNIQDWILICEDSVKDISSTDGHQLMNEHPYLNCRMNQVKDHLNGCLDYLASDDFSRLGLIIEKEALALHALMMTSSNPYFLIKPLTLQIISALWKFRKKTSCQLYFTLDAGPNIHLLFPTDQLEMASAFMEFLVSENVPLVKIIKDQIGQIGLTLNKISHFSL